MKHQRKSIIEKANEIIDIKEDVDLVLTHPIVQITKKFIEIGLLPREFIVDLVNSLSLHVYKYKYKNNYKRHLKKFKNYIKENQ